MENQKEENEIEQKKKYKYSTEKVKEYNKRFFEKHSEPITCDVCFQKYKYYSKHNHQRSKFHLLAEYYQKQNILQNNYFQK
jgi:hypothetical protein